MRRWIKNRFGHYQIRMKSAKASIAEMSLGASSPTPRISHRLIAQNARPSYIKKENFRQYDFQNSQWLKTNIDQKFGPASMYVFAKLQLEFRKTESLKNDSNDVVFSSITVRTKLCFQFTWKSIINCCHNYLMKFGDFFYKIFQTKIIFHHNSSVITF